MRQNGEELRSILDFAADKATAYREEIAARPQRAERSYAEMCQVFAMPTPETGSGGLDVIADLVERAAPGLNAMTGPRFFGWVVGASHPVGVAADWLTSAWGQNTGNHTATPAAAAAEAAAEGWLLDILDLPRSASVGFVTGATVANMTGLAAARSAVLRRAGWDVEADGLIGAPPVDVLIGDDAHTTVFAALQILGLGHRRVRRIATDTAGRIDADAFAREIDACDGPVIAVAQAGQINTGGFDPFARIVEAARGRNAWVHVDGAFGLWARACPETVALTEGVDGCDSWAVDGHKWLQTPYDCGYAIVRDADAHRRSMTAAASYLPGAGADERDPSHLTPELSRRARGFATWAIIRHLGRQGIADMVARHCRCARLMAERLSAEPDVAVLNDVELNQVIVRFGAGETPERGDALTHAVIARVQEDGVCFAGGAQWRGQWVMRLSVISWPTDEEEAMRSAEAIAKAWQAVRSDAVQLAG